MLQKHAITNTDEQSLGHASFVIVFEPSQALLS